MFVYTRKIQQAVSGRETEVLEALGIEWKRTTGNRHIRCPYPEHGGKDDWRWDARKAKAYCTCSRGDSIFDVLMKCEGIEFEDAKLRVAELLGRRDLVIVEGPPRWRSTKPAALMSPPRALQDDTLPRAYLEYRLGLTGILMPSTAYTGWAQFPYVEPAPTSFSGEEYQPVGEFPCAVFGTIDADGKTHAHRIYTAPKGQGKADLGTDASGKKRDPKKSASKVDKDESTSGRSVFWGAYETAPWVILTEGIETGAAVAQAFRSEIEAGSVTVAAAISASGIEGFKPFPLMNRVTIAADRDEASKEGRTGSKQGEESARKFGLAHPDLAASIALPGEIGSSSDWLDILQTEGIAAVRAGIQGAEPFQATAQERTEYDAEADRLRELNEIAAAYPLPHLNGLKLSYGLTPAGRARVYKTIKANDDQSKQLRFVVSTPFGVIARLRYLDQADAYGLRVVVQDMSGKPRVIDLDRAALAKTGGADIRALLFQAGLRTEGDGEAIVVQALKAADPEREILIVRKGGWHELAGLADPVFVCPSGEVIGTPVDYPVELSTASRMQPAVSRGGTLEGWKEAVAAALAVGDCPHWAIGVIGAFVGPLIALTGLDSCGINFSGLSSSGKSTAQRLAVSAWSKAAPNKDTLFQSAKATVNSTEAMAARSHATALVLDELAHVNGKEVGQLIYMIAGGAGKRRMSADQTLRANYSWSTFAMLSCESSLEEKVRLDGGDWMPGMAVRFPDIDVTGVNRAVDSGVFDRINGIDQHFGHAGPAFIQGLIRDGIQRDSTALRLAIDEAAARLAGPGAPGTFRRAAIPFALLLTAGEFAQEFGLVSDHIDVSAVVSWAWERYRKSSDAGALDPEGQAISRLNTWIAERWESSIHAIGSEQKPRDAVGWFDDNAIYLPRERLREATGNTLKENAIADALSRRGALFKVEDAKRKYLRYVRGVGRVECYALSRKMVGRTAEAPDQSSTLKAYSGGRA